MTYGELVATVHGMARHLGDVTWDFWYRQVAKSGLITPSTYLRVYLCPDASTIGWDPQAVAALFAPWSTDLRKIFPEMQWSGIHRHLHLSHWYTQQLAEEG
jgi:hypothetical protein